MMQHWRPVETDSDVEELLSTFGGFHDACLREVHLWTDTWIGNDLGMIGSGALMMHARLLFQRQFRDPSAIELRFDEVVGFNLASAENRDPIILDAGLFIRDGVIYWADWYEWRPGPPAPHSALWIGGKALRWRDASEWMGTHLRYGPGDADE